jgi:hypothetical protein
MILNSQANRCRREISNTNNFKKELIMFFQQGDVIIESSKIPAGAKKKDVKSRVVLAEGETTGHAHAITDLAACESFESNDQLYIRVLKDTVLTHEEHHAITIPKGDYEVRKVQEYDHFSEEARAVRD